MDVRRAWAGGVHEAALWHRGYSLQLASTLTACNNRARQGRQGGQGWQGRGQVNSRRLHRHRLPLCCCACPAATRAHLFVVPRELWAGLQGIDVYFAADVVSVGLEDLLRCRGSLRQRAGAAAGPPQLQRHVGLCCRCLRCSCCTIGGCACPGHERCLCLFIQKVSRRAHAAVRRVIHHLIGPWYLCC